MLDDNGHRVDDGSPKRGGSLLHALALAAVLVAVCATLALAWFSSPGDRTFVADADADGTTPLAFQGSYRVDGGAWLPLDGTTFEGPLIGIRSVAVKGRLSSAVPAGTPVNLRLSSTACVVRVNGVSVFGFDGLSADGPAAEPMLGWVSFPSPGIDADDEVEVELRHATLYSSRGDYELTFRTLCAGDEDSLRHDMIGLFSPMFACGVAVLFAGACLLLIASAGRFVGMPKERGSLLFACFVLLGGVWIFFCFDYITLLVPNPQFTAAVSLLSQDLLGIALVGFVVSRARGRFRRRARAVLIGLVAVQAAVVVLRLAGALSLFDANTFIVAPFEIAILAVAIGFMRDAFARRDRFMKEAAAAALPAAIGAFAEGLSYLIWGVSTGFALTAGIAFSVCVRFVALFLYAREQVALAERAHQVEQELVRSRIAITISQIQPHFLYNALVTIQYLCTDDPPLAARTVGDFAGYLRGNMDSLANDEPILFAKELDHLQHYVAIERLRFPNVSVVVEEGERDFLIPALTVQPLVENAIRHGLRRKRGGGTVVVSSWRDERGFHVSVADDGAGFDRPVDLADVEEGVPCGGDPSRSHVGLANVAFRVRVLCGGTVSLASRPGEGCRVEVTLPHA
ncbi:sensor histidine kinase [Arabiibacter massiliensis]|uniref:sensor histidine kinase n=1 Tax=Arabiibacter massiliensis TaxID=1870985 RepID=UPI0009B9C82C|nr:histidine kinase [Arabiibacter massiliensis]